MWGLQYTCIMLTTDCRKLSCLNCYVYAKHQNQHFVVIQIKVKGNYLSNLWIFSRVFTPNSILDICLTEEEYILAFMIHQRNLANSDSNQFLTGMTKQHNWMIRLWKHHHYINTPWETRCDWYGKFSTKVAQ